MKIKFFCSKKLQKKLSLSLEFMNCRLTTGCPTSNQTASIGLNYDLGDKSGHLRRTNYFEKFNMAKRNFFLQKMLDFCAYFGAKDWRLSNMIWGALQIRIVSVPLHVLVQVDLSGLYRRFKSSSSDNCTFLQIPKIKFLLFYLLSIFQVRWWNKLV